MKFIVGQCWTTLELYIVCIYQRQNYGLDYYGATFLTYLCTTPPETHSLLILPRKNIKNIYKEQKYITNNWQGNKRKCKLKLILSLVPLHLKFYYFFFLKFCSFSFLVHFNIQVLWLNFPFYHTWCTLRL